MRCTSLVSLPVLIAFILGTPFAVPAAGASDPASAAAPNGPDAAPAHRENELRSRTTAVADSYASAVPDSYASAVPDRAVPTAAPAPSGLDTALERRESERRSRAAAMEAVTLFVQATGKGGVIRGSGLALEDDRVLTLASVVGDDEEAVLLAAGEGLPPTPVTREAREERDGKRTGSDFVLLRFPYPPSFVIPMPVVFDDARPGDRVTAWGCVGTPLEKTEDKPEGAAHIYIPPPPVGSGGQVLSAEPGDRLRHSALPAAQAAGGPLAGRGKTVVGLNLGAPEADDGDGLVASARSASEIIAFLRACRGEPAPRPPAPGGAASTPDETAKAGGAPAPTSAKVENNDGTKPASERIETGEASTPKPAAAEGRRDPLPASAKADGSEGTKPASGRSEDNGAPAATPAKTGGTGDPGAASEKIEAGGETPAQVAGLLCSPQREDREKGATLLRGLVSRRDADPEALALFAWALRAGLLPDADAHEAPAAAEKAAKAGNSLGKAVLGLLYRDALLLPADPRKARALAEEAAAEGETLGISLSALSAYEDGSPDALREALRGAEKAAAAGDAAAMGLAACLYALHAEFTDYRTAEKRARVAAAGGDSLGLYILAGLYKDGRVTERDPVKAWACARLSLDRESGPHLEKRKVLFEELDGRLSEQEKEHGRRILRTLLLNRLPG
ncbi:MAG: hypothetical protein LBR82_06010 [Desulfovibrio sp.]|nr:hypothetical protein [Desulfovibrio sp.]